ncbi:MAG: ATP-binding protein [Oscillibacter sp.]|nr:ATP-binding protein [Oscillibacter sp.]MDY5711219.1 ATP-binding protein [Oscillospiraceae bacterium]
MTKKIFRSILTVGVAVLACSLLLVMGCFYSFYEGMQEHQLGDELRIAAAAVETNGSTYLEKIKSDRFRVTWIASDGTVLYDTQADAAQMENHLEREEVREALETGTGSSSRYSATLLQKTVYSASRLTDGTVLRLSASRATMGALLLGAFQPILLVVIVLLVLSSLLASRLAKRIVEPLNALDLEHPLENDAYEELSPLLRRIDRQRRQIDAQLAELRQKTDEFTQITAGMNEGLVLLDEKGAVLNINPAAQTLFGVTGACVGQDFLTVDREHSMSLALRTAMTDGHSEVRAERGGREYQFDLSRIESDGKVVGAVLLAFDMTAQAFAERSRREFTANVSHELKTPLQGIIGSVELLENGMVKPEDMPRFVGHIRAEAQRLVTLIGDIIRLSELDEGGELPTETVDLLPLAQEAAENLRAAAEAKGVTVTVSGENAPVIGVRRLLYEIAYNLCDNAIKYNADGGSVDVRVGAEGSSACLTVCDTGIGISPEHQSRIFERFYRVDKSHSKASGGTGLGLSIVKHAVAYHHGTIALKSEVGKGTEIAVRFPQEK